MKTCWPNILETSTVTLAAGTEDASFPLTRLYDRKIGEPFQAAAAVTTTVKVDQGASPQAVDRLLIAGHNLAGVALNLQYSDDDITYLDAVPGWTQPDGTIIDQSWASAAHRYWEFTATAPVVIPSICEMFLTSTWVWEKDASRPDCGPFDDLGNMQNYVTRTGKDRFLVNGPAKRQRPYKVRMATEAMKVNALALNADYLGGGHPFFLYDHEGVWIFGKFSKEMAITPVSYQRYDIEFPFLEVLP